MSDSLFAVGAVAVLSAASLAVVSTSNDALEQARSERFSAAANSAPQSMPVASYGRGVEEKNWITSSSLSPSRSVAANADDNSSGDSPASSGATPLAGNQVPPSKSLSALSSDPLAERRDADQEHGLADSAGQSDALAAADVVGVLNVNPPAGTAAIRTPTGGLAGNELTIIDQVQIDGGNRAGTTGVSITGASSGRILFTDSDTQNAVGMSIRNTTGAGFHLDGTGAAANLDVDYNGSLSTSAGTAISIANLGVGRDVSFNDSSITVSGGQGFAAHQVAGTVRINSSFVQNGGSGGIDIQSSTGSFLFANASLTNPTGNAINVMSGAPALTFVGNATSNISGRLINIDGIGNNAGPQTFDLDFVGGTLQANGAATSGIRVANTTGGATIRFSDVALGQTTAVGGEGVILSDNHLAGGGTTTFDSLLVTSNGGIGLDWSNGGTVNVATGSVNSTGALGMNVSGTAAGAMGVNLVGLTVNNATGGGVNLAGNVGTWNLQGVAITTIGGVGFQANNAGSLSTGGQVNSNMATAIAVSGGTLLNANFTNVTSTDSAAAGISLSGLANGSSFTASSGMIRGADSNAIDIQNGAGNASFAISNMNITLDPALNGRTGILVNSGDGNVTIASNSVDVNGTLVATGIFVQGNGSPSGFNLGTGSSTNNVTSNLGAGSTGFNFFNGGNITGDIQVDGVIFNP